ncbi:MAG TPA: DUF1836 domain-containing protein [Clostridiales bacterium]|nr:DUF1836 domain-containing protein [Clostridiales bacterium]
MKYDLDALKNEVDAEKLLSAADIPDLDLYMDQLLTLINGKGEAPAALTKTMVNNYSKEKIIAPVKGKKYTKEQVLQIYTVFLLKNTLSMGEIKAALTDFYAESEDEHLLEKAYQRFNEGAAGDVEDVFSLLRQKFPDSEAAVEEDHFVMLLHVCFYSRLFQQLAKKMIAGITENKS